jgi:hypothetical protein
MNEEILIPIFFFGAIAAILWKFFDTRHKERMSIIEKGLVKEDLKYLYSSVTWKANPYSSLKYGMLAAFIGLGILVSALVNRFVWEYQEMVTTGIIFLSGGVGLISYYVIIRKKIDLDTAEKQ